MFTKIAYIAYFRRLQRTSEKKKNIPHFQRLIKIDSTWWLNHLLYAGIIGSSPQFSDENNLKPPPKYHGNLIRAPPQRHPTHEIRPVLGKTFFPREAGGTLTLPETKIALKMVASDTNLLPGIYFQGLFLLVSGRVDPHNNNY